MRFSFAKAAERFEAREVKDSDSVRCAPQGVCLLSGTRLADAIHPKFMFISGFRTGGWREVLADKENRGATTRPCVGGAMTSQLQASPQNENWLARGPR